MDRPRNLVLIGLMGTGKTTAGREAARRLGLTFVDTDEEIVRQTGLPVPEIFRTRGEAAFREIEADVIRSLAETSGLVIATGGGAVVNPVNFTNLRRHGLVIALTAATDTLWNRLSAAGDRPLLSGPDPRSRLEELASLRAPVYAQADQVIDTTALDPATVTSQVCAAYRLAAALKLDVQLGDRSYPICIGDGILPGLGLAARQVSRAGEAILVSNETVAPLFAAEAIEALQTAGFRVTQAVLPDGEKHKTLVAVQQLYDVAVQARLGRDGLAVALGGGVIGDTTGFFAATYMRGIDFLQVPTTLLAQIDSSVGGKVGVNHPQGKNLIGAFHQPVAVVTDIATLKSLPLRELRAGLAEAVKTAVIGDEELLRLLESLRPESLAQETAILGEIVARCCRIKAEVVREDEREGGRRAVLNLGHTVGHAIEAATGFQRYLHGEAVAIGMVTALLLATRRGLCSERLVDRVTSALRGLGLPVAPSGVTAEELVSHLAKDKKSKRGRVLWVLPRSVGEVTIGHEVDEALVLACLQEQLAMGL